MFNGTCRLTSGDAPYLLQIRIIPLSSLPLCSLCSLRLNHSDPTIIDITSVTFVTKSVAELVFPEFCLNLQPVATLSYKAKKQRDKTHELHQS